MRQKPPARFRPRTRARGLAVAALTAALLCGPAQAVLGDDDDHTADSPPWWTDVDGYLALSQQNYDEILAEVTSSNDQDYTDAAVSTGGNTPFKFRLESHCADGTDGSLLPPLTQIETSGVLYELKLLGPVEWVRRYTPMFNAGQDHDITVNVLNQDSLDANDFQPLSFIPSGSSVPEETIAAIKAAAIDRCNARLASIKQNNPNLNDASALISSGGVVEVQWDNVTAQQVCTHQRIYLEGQDGSAGHSDIFERQVNTGDLTVVGKVQCISPFSPPSPASGDIAQAFGVLSAELAAQPNFHRGECPVNVVFNASVVTQGVGQLEVEVRNQAGELRLTRMIDVTKAGPQNFSFFDTFDYPSIQGSGDLAPGAGGDGATGPGLTTPQPTGDPGQLGFQAAKAAAAHPPGPATSRSTRIRPTRTRAGTGSPLRSRPAAAYNRISRRTGWSANARRPAHRSLRCPSRYAWAASCRAANAPVPMVRWPMPAAAAPRTY